MKIEGQVVVSVAYTLKNAEGVVLDDSTKDHPFEFIHNSGLMLKAFDEQFEGKGPGHTFKFEVSAEDGYGQYEEERIQQLPKEIFGEEFEEIELGLDYPMNTEEGYTVMGVVIGKDKNSVTMDFNHALAGEHLFFEGEVLNVRPATEQELEEGILDSGHDH